MKFELDADQELLRATVAEALKVYTIENYRKALASEIGYLPTAYQSLVEIGVPALAIPEAKGGAGAGADEIYAVQIAIGKALAPEPFLTGAFIPSWLLNRIESSDTSDALLAAISEGTLVALAHQEPHTRWPDFQTSTAATASDENHTLTGIKLPVLAGDHATSFLVTAHLNNQLALFLVDAAATGLTRKAFTMHDGRRGAQLTFADTPATLLGTTNIAAVLSEVEVLTQIALAAEAVGIMEQLVATTADYLKTRKQFGVPLAKFQTLTHRAAEMFVALELARSLAIYGSAAAGSGDLRREIGSQVKLQICKSARTIGLEAIQLHGGIGMTAEYPVGHYVNRLTAITHTLGGYDDHRGYLAARVSNYAMVTVV